MAKQLSFLEASMNSSTADWNIVIGEAAQPKVYRLTAAQLPPRL